MSFATKTSLYLGACSTAVLLHTTGHAAVADDKFLGKFGRWEANRTTNNNVASMFHRDRANEDDWQARQTGRSDLDDWPFPAAEIIRSSQDQGRSRIEIRGTLEFVIGNKKVKLLTAGDSGFADARLTRK